MLPICKESKSIDISECVANEPNTRQKCKNVKNRTENAAGREVTDPVTHLPNTIHDFPSNGLTMVPINIPPNEPNQQTSSKTDIKPSRLEYERKQSRSQHRGLGRLFARPNFEAMRAEFANIDKRAITIGLGSILVKLTVLYFGAFLVGLDSTDKDFNKMSKS